MLENLHKILYVCGIFTKIKKSFHKKDYVKEELSVRIMLRLGNNIQAEMPVRA